MAWRCGCLAARLGPDSPVDWRAGEQAIQRGLSKRLAQLAAERERRERAAAKADAEFSAEFLSMARKCFDLIDKDGSGTLEKPEIVQAVRADKEVINFLTNCGNKNLQYLLVPSRLDAALNAMDTDRDGHIDADEWEECIEIALNNKLAARAASVESGAAHTPSTRHGAYRAIPPQRAGRPGRPGRDTLPRQLRQPEPPVPVGAGAPRRGAERDGYR